MGEFNLDECFCRDISQKFNEQNLQFILSNHGDIELTMMNDRISVTFKNKNHLIESLLTAEHKISQLRKNYSPIDKLSDDCLAKIFSCLPIPQRLTIEKVCRRWRKISRAGWPDVKQITWQSEYSKFTRREVEDVFERSGRYLRILEIPVENEKQSYLAVVHRYCELLEEIKITFPARPIREYNGALSRIFRNCKKLSSITIDNVHSDFTYDCFEKLDPKIVTEIQLAVADSDVRNTRASMNVSKFRSLKRLKFCKFVLGTEDLIGLDQLENLTSLDLRYCWVDNSQIMKISNLQKLEYLSLEETAFAIRDHHMSRIAKNCKNLKTLILYNRYGELSDNSFKDIAKLPHLEILNMAFITGVSDCTISAMQNLIQLDCRGCEGIGNDGLIDLIKCAPNLQKIWVSWTSINQHFLEEANDAMNTRMSGVALILELDPAQKKWKKPENLSPLLILSDNWYQ
ncbi:uncharacterized protein LOC135162270 [Diachasmimorpha longicaudata]|uniref:uncharacterized protein LOC135162270 n=1 Tax=Diachasmimorpha longicaudata TaxID=58733 RepID=UPI0030B87689